MRNLFTELGQIVLFEARAFKLLFSRHLSLRPIIEQIAFVSWHALGTIAVAGIFVGAILVIQFELMLSKYDAIYLLGGLNTSAVVREIGPLLISFLLAGKVGAYTAAELGTMRVTEQIDAIECLGTDPMEYLVLPRFIAIISASLLLLGLGLLLSIGGSMAVALSLFDINALRFVSNIHRFVGGWTIFCGLFKSFVYGLIVAGVCCYQGFHASGGARGVGKAVTQTAILTNFYIVIANFITSRFLELLHGLFWGSA